MAVGNWRVIGHDTGPAARATDGAALVHSAPSVGVRDWSDLRIAVSAGVWLAGARPGDVIEIVSDDQAFDAVGDVAASLGVTFRRTSYRALAGGRSAPQVEAPSSEPRPHRSRRGGRRGYGGERRAPEPPRMPVAPPVSQEPHTAPHDEIIGLVRELLASAPGGVSLDALANALRERGFSRPAGSPRLITRLRRSKRARPRAQRDDQTGRQRRRAGRARRRSPRAGSAGRGARREQRGRRRRIGRSARRRDGGTDATPRAHPAGAGAAAVRRRGRRGAGPATAEATPETADRPGGAAYAIPRRSLPSGEMIWDSVADPRRCRRRRRRRRQREQLVARIGGDRRPHAAALRGQRHLHVHQAARIAGSDPHVVDQSQVDDVHGISGSWQVFRTDQTCCSRSPPSAATVSWMISLPMASAVASRKCGRGHRRPAPGACTSRPATG